MYKKIFRLLDLAVGILFFPFWIFLLINLFLFKSLLIKKNANILVFSWHPITMYSTLALALKTPNRKVQSVSKTFFSKIQTGNEWDILIDNSFRFCPLSIKLMLFFLIFLRQFDIYIITCDGFLFGLTPLARFEKIIFTMFNKKTIVIPYGGDAYVYKRVSSPLRAHGLQLSYPDASRNQKNISKRVDYWVKNADLFIPGVMFFDGYGRWDVLIPSTIFLDINNILPSNRKSLANGSDETVFITHSPNHRGVKGTQFIIDAVKSLKKEGLKVELILTEGMQNSDLLKVYEHDSDIHVEQLLLSATGINGLEAMASGLPLIANTEPIEQYQLLKDFSYFDECPVFSANPNSIIDSLRILIENPDLRLELGKAGRKYIEKYHSFQSAKIFFNSCFEYLLHDGDHPQVYLEKLILDSKKIKNPLKNITQ